jgi:hypothetical protein
MRRSVTPAQGLTDVPEEEDTRRRSGTATTDMPLLSIRHAPLSLELPSPPHSSTTPSGSPASFALPSSPGVAVQPSSRQARHGSVGSEPVPVTPHLMRPTTPDPSLNRRQDMPNSRNGSSALFRMQLGSTDVDGFIRTTDVLMPSMTGLVNSREGLEPSLAALMHDRFSSLSTVPSLKPGGSGEKSASCQAGSRLQGRDAIAALSALRPVLPRTPGPAPLNAGAAPVSVEAGPMQLAGTLAIAAAAGQPASLAVAGVPPFGAAAQVGQAGSCPGSPGSAAPPRHASDITSHAKDGAADTAELGATPVSVSARGRWGATQPTAWKVYAGQGLRGEGRRLGRGCASGICTGRPCAVAREAAAREFPFLAASAPQLPSWPCAPYPRSHPRVGQYGRYEALAYS